MPPFEIRDIRELILTHRKNGMERDMWKGRYDTVVDDLSCHQYYADYIARYPGELIICCEEGLLDFNAYILIALVAHR